MRNTPHRQPAGKGVARWVFLALAGCGLATGPGCASGEPAVGTGEKTRSNLVIMKNLVGEMGKVVLDSAGHRMRDTVVLDVDSSASSWIARTELGVLLGSSNKRVLTPGRAVPAGSRWSVRGLTLTVEYRDIRRTGFFSGAVVDRVVTAAFTSEITDGDTVVFTGTTAGSITDTVDESRIEELESRSMDFTRGDIPDLRSFDRFIEPFVIIGATGAAILLFFQVRS